MPFKRLYSMASSIFFVELALFWALFLALMASSHSAFQYGTAFGRHFDFILGMLSSAAWIIASVKFLLNLIGSD